MLRFTLTSDDLVAFNLHVGRTGAFRGPQTVARLLLTALPVLAGFLIGLIEGAPLWGVLASAALGAVVWFTWAKRWEWLMRRLLARSARRGGLGTTGEYRLWLDDAGLHERAAHGVIEMSLASVAAVDETDEHLFVMVGPTHGFIVPKRIGEPRWRPFLAELRARLADRSG